MYEKNIYLLLISSFYAVGILTTKFQGYRHATYQQIIVSTCMDFDWLCISVCTTLVNETVVNENETVVESRLVKLFKVYIYIKVTESNTLLLIFDYYLC